MKEQMRIELHNETEYTERISFQDIWTHASRLKYAGCNHRPKFGGWYSHGRARFYAERNPADLRRNAQLHRC